MRFVFIWLDHAPEVSDLDLKVFCTLRHYDPTFEKKYDYIELFCLLFIEFYLKQHNFEDNISAKIEVSGSLRKHLFRLALCPWGHFTKREEEQMFSQAK